ncbi:hypothetical protein ABZ920_10650 [Streptomyces sp. NPDC046831]|uniref:hypothetical protein n=1 Tax=Streptomyces sp. NPDC046831 TaxID=3154805 RepID=UPI0033DD4888
MSQDELPANSEATVVDVHSLYRIALGHTERGAALRESVRRGTLRLVVPTLTFGVACAMRTCWDEECDRGHPLGTGPALRRFLDGRGVETAELTPDQQVAAAQLYAVCTDRRVTGAEVLAACHSVVVAEARRMPLVSAVRASYCYLRLPEQRPGRPTSLV